jgi:hypothetical protein
VRYFLPHLFIAALAGFLIGLPKALALRRPMSKEELCRYDALRFVAIRSIEEWRNPPVCTARDLWCWFRNVWWNRPRSRPFWSTKKGDLGRSAMNSYARITEKK